MNTKSLQPAVKKWIERFKTDKRALLILSVGVLACAAILLLWPNKTAAKSAASKETQTFDESAMRTQLAALLSSVRGAGRTEVMLTFESGSETVYAADTDASFDRRDSGESDTRKADVVLVKDGTNENGLQVKEVYPRVRGVAVVCEGGANPVIRAQIISLVTALFDIKSTNVSVAEMAAKEESS